MLGLLAVAQDRPVGVDVERIREVSDVLGIADAHFSAVERRRLRSLPPAERRAAFIRCWTRKEAVLKASGEGLGLRLDSFDVDRTDPSHANPPPPASPSYTTRLGLTPRQLRRRPRGGLDVCSGAICRPTGEPGRMVLARPAVAIWLRSRRRHRDWRKCADPVAEPVRRRSRQALRRQLTGCGSAVTRD
jgi:hypothetical protein